LAKLKQVPGLKTPGIRKGHPGKELVNEGTSNCAGSIEMGRLIIYRKKRYEKEKRYGNVPQRSRKGKNLIPKKCGTTQALPEKEVIFQNTGGV